MEIAIRKFMQITLNIVSNLIFNGFHLIHLILSTKPPLVLAAKAKHEPVVTTGFNLFILPKFPNLPSYTNVWF